jgi:hypothetical protein
MRHLGSVALAVALLSVAACGSSNPNSPSGSSVPQFGFNWTGNFQITSCTPSNSAVASLCGSVTIGALDSFTMTLSQSGTVVSGPFTIGATAFPSTGGSITNDVLSLQSSVTINGTTSQGAWSLTVSGSQLAGTVAFTVSNTAGGVTIAGAIVSSSHS